MQKEIKLRIIGTSVSTQIDGKLLKTTIKDRHKKDLLKEQVAMFNKKPSQYWLDRIKKKFEVPVKVSSEKVQAKKAKQAVKEVKTKIKSTKQQEKIARTVAEIADDAKSVTTKQTVNEAGSIVTSIGAAAIEKKAEEIKKVAENEPKPVEGKAVRSPEFYGRRW